MCSLWTSAIFSLHFRRLEHPTLRAARIVSCGPVATIIARSTTLRSSRMLPGQACCCSAAMFSLRNRINPLAERLRELVDEAPDEEGNILGALAQRRHPDREDVEPVEQVLTERILRHPLLQVAVRRRDDPDIHMHGSRASEPLDLPLFEHPQQLDLNVGRQVADLVEENRRVVGQFEAADLSRQRAGKRAPLAAEQLALHQRTRNRRAIDAHHGPPPPRAQFVNMRRDELLAGARLTEQQHGRIGGRHLPGLFQDAAHGDASSDDDAGAGRSTSWRRHGSRRRCRRRSAGAETLRATRSCVVAVAATGRWTTAPAPRWRRRVRAV